MYMYICVYIYIPLCGCSPVLYMYMVTTCVNASVYVRVTNGYLVIAIDIILIKCIGF